MLARMSKLFAALFIILEILT